VSYGVAKWHENSGSMLDLKVKYIRTTAANMLRNTQNYTH